MIVKTKRGGAAMAAATTVVMMFHVSVASGAGTPEQKCEAGKNDASGKYAACLSKAEKSLVTSGDAGAFALDVAACAEKLVSTWEKLESAATSAGTSCPSTGDQADVENFVTACDAVVAAALSGDPLPTDVLTCNEDLDDCNDMVSICDSDIATCEGDIAAAQSNLATCEGDLATCQGALDLGLPKTGQTICYTSGGAVTPCAGTGQDGEKRAGATPSYTDNGNGTITDNVTKLMWEKLSDDGSIHDKDLNFTGMLAAAGKATTLNTALFAGHNDWRLPNRRELESIIDLGRSNPAVNPVFHTGCVGGCTVLTCSCTHTQVYYTSSTYFGYTPASWKVVFGSGDIYAGDRDEAHKVRVVRNVY